MAGIFVEIVGNASQFKRELDSAVASTAKANSGFARMGRAAGVAGLALGGALAVGLVHAAKGAMEDQIANERLAQSFKDAHVPIGAFKDQIDKATAAAVKMGFHDEAAAEALGSLVTATHNGKQAMDLLGTAEDIARFKHVELTDAAKMLTSTMAGNVRSAKALGIILLPVTSHVDALRARYKELGEAIPPAELATARIADKQATAAQAIGKVNDALHGQAQAFSETATGKAQVFNAQMDQLSDNLGKTLLPAINKTLDGLNRLSGAMAQHTEIAKVMAAAVGVLSLSLYAFSVAAAVATGAAIPITAPILAAIIAIGTLSFVVYKLVTDFRNSWPLLLPIVLGPLGAIIAAVIHWHSQIAAAFSAAWNAVKSITSAGVNAVLGVIRGAIGAAGAAAASVGHAILNGIMGVVNTIDNKVRAAFGAVWAAIRGLVGVALGVGKAIGEAVVHGIISGLTGLASKAAGIVRDAISHLPHVNIPGFSPIEGVGHEIGQRIGSGILRGLQEARSPIIKQMQSLIGSAAHAIDPNTPFVEPMKAAKRAFDSWADTTATDNFAGVGRALGRALSDGVSGVGPRVAQSTLGKGLIPLGGSLGNGTSNPQLGTQIGIGGNTPTAPVVIHNVLTLDGKTVYDSWKQQAARDVKRNGGTGIRS